MTPPKEEIKQYSSLYHDFTEAYTNVHVLTREFYPVAKKFVESTEPEINRYVKKISEPNSTGASPRSYQMLLHYMNHFDDFTLNANKLFRELQLVLDKSDGFMIKVLDIKQKMNEQERNEVKEPLLDLMPELNELLTSLKMMPGKAEELETRMRKLQADWNKTKEKFTASA
jgi:hypothetical protein